MSESQEQSSSSSSSSGASGASPTAGAAVVGVTQTGESLGPTVEVTVKTLDDRETSVRIGSNQTVQALVDIARGAFNINSGQQRIIFGGRVLNSAITIQAAGITNGQTVHLVDRGPASANDRPNIPPPPTFTRPPHVTGNPTAMLQRLMNENLTSGVSPMFAPMPFQILPPVRVPAAIGGVPVISARFAEDCIQQKALPLRTRPGSSNPQFPQVQNPSAFHVDPHFIQWTVRVVDDVMLRPRSKVEQMIRSVVEELVYIPERYRNAIAVSWDTPRQTVTIQFPELPPHVPSPALEKLDFLSLWNEHLTRFIDKLVENDGLVDAVRQVLEMVNDRESTVNLPELGINQRLNALDAIIRDLEAMWIELSHQKDYERARFRKNNTEEYRQLKIEHHPRTPRNPKFFMRHALDTDLLEVIRAFRRQRLRFAALEDLLDDLNEAGALKFIRDSMSDSIDYRYRALSMYFTYMQRMRHQVAHMTHLCADLDVPFMTPGQPQRLLPNYATNVLQVPYPHAGTLVIKFEKPRNDDPPFETPISHIIEPPRLLSDLKDRCNRDYPYLPYYPPSVHLEAVQAAPRRVHTVNERAVQPTITVRAPTQPHFHIHGHGHAHAHVHPPPGPPVPPQHFVLSQETAQNGGGFLAATDPLTGMTLQDVINMQQEQVEALIASNPALEGSRVRVTTRPRRFVTTGDAPSVPVETQPPPGEPAARRYTNYRFAVNPEARGPETETLAPLPVQIEPSELQRIARNVASRYRAEALQRIATNLTSRFNDESWDTRIQNMPLCTLRECVAIALELLTSSGNSVAESRDLMLALVRDEEVLVRAIAECVKSLFGRGEFPTHVSRIIMPRNETASSRNDYESVDHVDEAQSDEYDGMIVRVPSDISQPQSGDLRAIRERRQSRRAFLENRGRIASTSSAASTSSSTPPAAGPSFNSEDAAEIRAGRLPLGNRPTRRTVRETVHPTPAVPRPESPGPNISLTFTATTHSFPAFVPMNIPGPSTSQPIPPWEAPIIPIRQVVSPTPTTRALHDFDISDVSDQNTAATPSPPAPTPRSAPATVTSSPTRQDAMETESAGSGGSGGSSGADLNEAARQAARLARARIDHLAATFNGNLSETRRQNPFNPPGPTTPLDDPRRSLTRDRYSKPMVAIDPFMNCSNRHCELSRLSNPSHMADLDRYTLQSIRPDEEFSAYVQGMLPITERRPQKVPLTDEDYDYLVRRNSNGELSFHNVDIFKKFLKTMIRSLLANCVDADTLLTMNIFPISGYPAANHTELVKLVRDHLSIPAEGPTSMTRPSTWTARSALNAEQHRERIETWNRNARAGMEYVANQAAQLRQQIEAMAEGGPAPNPAQFPSFPPGLDVEQEVLIPGQVASLLTYIVDYMENTSNPRPTGIFRIVLELTHDRLTRHDYAQLARRSTAVNVVAEYEGMIRSHIRHTYMGGRYEASNAELQMMAETLANNEEFFTRFMNQNDHMPQEIEIEGTVLNVAWVLQQIEITLIKALLTLSQVDLDSPSAVQQILKCFDAYLQRNLFVFWRMNNGVPYQVKNQLYRISDFFATIRFANTTPDGRTLSDFVSNWNRVMDYWFDKYKDIPEESVIRYLLNVRSQAWNDVSPHSTDEPSTSSSTSSGVASSSSASAAGPSTVPSTSSNSTVAINNPRKRNHDGNEPDDYDDVDVVAPLMTSLSTSSPMGPSGSGTSQQGPSSSSFMEDQLE